MLLGTVGIVVSIGVGTAVLGAVIAVFLVKCYLNWKRQHRKQKKRSGSPDGTVQQLVLSSQPVDFVPLLIQDTLEEEDEEEALNASYLSISGTSSEDLSLHQSKDKKEFKVR